MLSSERNTLRTAPPTPWSEVAPDGAIIAIAMVAFWAAAWVFARGQSIWVDETTQMYGIQQSFGTSMAWLTTTRPEVHPVPFDRMPPLSYLLGMAWSGIFGFSENALRIMGIVFASLAIPALYLSGRMFAGRLGGLFVVVFVAVSANAMGYASAIRAYPIYFAATAWAILAYCRIVFLGGITARYLALTACLIVAMYLHFYGCVAAFCLGLSLLVWNIATRQPVAPLFLWAGILAVAALGLLPFIQAATSISGQPDAGANGSGLRDVVVATARLAYRIVAHPVYEVVPALRLGHLALIGVLGLIALVRLVTGIDRKPAAIVLPLAIGFAFLAVVDLAVDGFEVQAPHYNIWMIPLVGLFLATALAQGGGMVRKAGSAVGIGLMATTLVGTGLLLRHASLYSNGPGDWTFAQIADPDRTLVIHEGTTWGSLYFPLVYLSAGKLEQWLQADDGTMTRLLPGQHVPLATADQDTTRFSKVIRARGFILDGGALAALARGDVSCGDLAGAKATDRSYCAFFGVTLTEANP